MELDLRELSLREVVEGALSYCDPEGRFRIEVDAGLRVIADRDRLEQILINLATNALRHGAPPFTVSAACRDGSVVVCVRDRGAGVPEQSVGSLFEPFRRGDTAGSVGFGLWVVRMLTEAHGGRVASLTCQRRLKTEHPAPLES